MIDLLIKVLLSYLLGSVSGSMVMGRVRHVDIRQSGSGNAGGTNAFRTQGLRFALGVVVIDIGKGALAAGLLPWLGEVLAGPGTQPEQTALACGFMAVVGHCYPVWHGFRGGKGAATAVGAVLALFIVFMHRSNIRKLIAGTEHRFERIRIVNWFGRG